MALAVAILQLRIYIVQLELMIPSAPPLPVLLRISQDRAANPSRSSTLVEDVWLMVFKIRVVVPSSKEHAFAYPSPAVTFSSLSKYCVLFWIDDWRLMRMIITRVKPSDRCLTTSMSLMAKLYDGASASISLPVVFCINLVLSSVVGAAEEPKEKLKDVLDDRFHAWARNEDGEEAKEKEQELKLRRLEWRAQMQWEMDQEDRKQALTLSTRAKAPDCHNFSCNAPKDHVLDLAKIAEKWGIEDSLHSTEGLDFVGFLDA
ncbi:hypothetical protein K435DRAFT_793161 [Dendrothele bispora CBS 962.96]|uniref:Uncharacterized protein n=1 Tax=Dendrothele bispora (strain CBS 962.96) TaxID=1314807 RepID=A0A4S8MGS0_DENBC|nr:hypothetical protein K435DRAFT_793161 [Dendrothele bispora CBS 962.96]